MLAFLVVIVCVSEFSASCLCVCSVYVVVFVTVLCFGYVAIILMNVCLYFLVLHVTFASSIYVLFLPDFCTYYVLFWRNSCFGHLLNSVACSVVNHQLCDVHGSFTAIR